jgi:hypothetical protein
MEQINATTQLCERLQISHVMIVIEVGAIGLTFEVIQTI